MSEGVRVFAQLTGADAGHIEGLATEYHNFGWNLREDEVVQFMRERPAGSTYAIIERGTDLTERHSRTTL